jgi:hypothetical protein
MAVLEAAHPPRTTDIAIGDGVVVLCQSFAALAGGEVLDVATGERFALGTARSLPFCGSSSCLRAQPDDCQQPPSALLRQVE